MEANPEPTCVQNPPCRELPTKLHLPCLLTSRQPPARLKQGPQIFRSLKCCFLLISISQPPGLLLCRTSKLPPLSTCHLHSHLHVTIQHLPLIPRSLALPSTNHQGFAQATPVQLLSSHLLNKFHQHRLRHLYLSHHHALLNPVHKQAIQIPISVLSGESRSTFPSMELFFLPPAATSC